MALSVDLKHFRIKYIEIIFFTWIVLGGFFFFSQRHSVTCLEVLCSYPSELKYYCWRSLVSFTGFLSNCSSWCLWSILCSGRCPSSQWSWHTYPLDRSQWSRVRVRHTPQLSLHLPERSEMWSLSREKWREFKIQVITLLTWQASTPGLWAHIVVDSSLWYLLSGLSFSPHAEISVLAHLTLLSSLLPGN